MYSVSQSTDQFYSIFSEKAPLKLTDEAHELFPTKLAELIEEGRSHWSISETRRALRECYKASTEEIRLSFEADIRSFVESLADDRLKAAFASITSSVMPLADTLKYIGLISNQGWRNWINDVVLNLPENFNIESIAKLFLPLTEHPDFTRLLGKICSRVSRRDQDLSAKYNALHQMIYQHNSTPYVDMLNDSQHFKAERIIESISSIDFLITLLKQCPLNSVWNIIMHHIQSLTVTFDIRLTGDQSSYLSSLAEKHHSQISEEMHYVYDLNFLKTLYENGDERAKSGALEHCVRLLGTDYVQTLAFFKAIYKSNPEEVRLAFEDRYNELHYSDWAITLWDDESDFTLNFSQGNNKNY